MHHRMYLFNHTYFDCRFSGKKVFRQKNYSFEQVRYKSMGGNIQVCVPGFHKNMLRTSQTPAGEINR